MDPPPPPPPHGANTGNRGSGLPPGNYDIFIIPPHSSGSGFLYLPSLQPHRNSFLAGIGCTLLAMAIWSVVFPVLREWFATIVASGGMAVVVLLIGVGVAGWAWGKTQIEGGRPAGGAAGGTPNPQPQAHPHPQPNSHAHTSSHPNHHPPPNPPHSNPPPPGPPPHSEEPRPPPKPTWQRANTGPSPTTGTAHANGTASAGAAKGAWEKAREEFKKKEEERKRSEDLRKRAEELRKKREEEEKERAQQREKDAREREVRERREKYTQERAAREKAREAAAQAAAKEAAAKEAAHPASHPTPQPVPQPVPQPASREASRPPSTEKRHHQPTAKTATDDDAFSFRPYDKPKRPVHKTTSASSVYSESSYAPSQSTSRTTPPPSHRGPYRTKDPDKIVIKAVYSFNNTFTKLPIAQLVSGVGSVTDGLILRITTEGLFIDDDVRGVPQREWDVKAWTLKLVEVWCPNLQTLGASSGSTPASRTAGRSGFLGSKSATKAPTIEESDLLLENLLRTCKASCFVTKSSWTCTTSSTTSSSRDRSNASASSQSGEFKGLHVLRASIRDQEGKRYVFVLQEEEGWKVAVGLQRLRRGTQVRALAVSGMPANETRAILENMGWS